MFSAQDRESGLSIIDVDDHTISTVWTEEYSPGQVIRPITGKVRLVPMLIRMKQALGNLNVFHSTMNKI